MKIERIFLGTARAVYSPESVAVYFSGATNEDLHNFSEIIKRRTSKPVLKKAMFMGDDKNNSIIYLNGENPPINDPSLRLDTFPEVALLQFRNRKPRTGHTYLHFGNEDDMRFVFFAMDRRHYKNLILNKNSPREHVILHSSDILTGVSILEGICKSGFELNDKMFHFNGDVGIKKELLEKYG